MGGCSVYFQKVGGDDDANLAGRPGGESGMTREALTGIPGNDDSNFAYAAERD